ncbi:MAG: 50S ribosomal protein L11 methyltransferase [Bacillota bacterium]
MGETIWTAVSASLTREAAEALAFFIGNMDVPGVMIEDNALRGQGDYVIEPDPPAVAKAEVQLTVYFFGPADARIEAVRGEIERLRRYLEVGSGTVRLEMVREEDWENAWKSYYGPVKIGPGLVIRPSWVDYSPLPGETIVSLDPGMAFGTGTHPTTRMCLAFLQKYISEGAAFLDIGTGSGILSIAACLLGAKRALGLDTDAMAVGIAARNALINGVADKAVFRPGELPESDEKGVFSLVCANIITDIIEGLIPRVVDYITGGGIFISSGIIENRSAEVKIGLSAAGFTLLCEERLEGWSCLAAQKRS